MPATATILGRIAEPVLRWTQGGHAVLELSKIGRASCRERV